MGMDIFGIAYSGLNAARAGMATSQSNTANVNTPGYHRREVSFASTQAAYTGSGYMGSGVDVQTVQRVYSQFLDTEVRISQSMTERYNSYAIYADAIDKMLGDANTGLSGAMQQFFDAADDVSNDPTSTAARQSLISSGEVLANRFHSLDASLATMQKSINDQTRQIVDQINQYTSQIASLNERIGRFEASTGQPANDLIDMRGQLTEDLNKLINVNVLEQDGNYNLFIGNGQSLVIGATANALTTTPDPYDPENLLPAYKQGGNSLVFDTRQITGGSLGGLLAFREEILQPAQRELDRLAYVVSDQFNDIHNNGADLEGNVNIDFFDPAGSITSQTALDLNATASPATVSLNVVNTRQLTGSDYVLVYNTATTDYTLTRLSDGTNWTLSPPSPMTATGEGFTLSVAGAPNDGDRWLIRPVNDAARQIDVAVSNPNNVAAASPSLSAFAGLGNVNRTVMPSTPTLTGGAPYDTNLLQPVTITYDQAGSQYVLTGTISPPAGPAPVNVPRVAGVDTVISVNGWSLTLSDGAVIAADDLLRDGDSYTVQYTAIGDNSNALAFAALQTDSTSIEGNMTYSSTYGQLVSDVATKTRDAKVTAEAQQKLLDDAQTQRANVSGVNLDEEAVRLVQYQQAYQAAAKAIQVATTLFDELLNVVR